MLGALGTRVLAADLKRSLQARTIKWVKCKLQACCNGLRRKLLPYFWGLRFRGNQVVGAGPALHVPSNDSYAPLNLFAQKSSLPESTGRSFWNDLRMVVIVPALHPQGVLNRKNLNEGIPSYIHRVTKSTPWGTSPRVDKSKRLVL